MVTSTELHVFLKECEFYVEYMWMMSLPINRRHVLLTFLYYILKSVTISDSEGTE